MNYGLPYMGSKSRIAAQVAAVFPKAKHFYDLFAGGCSVTHYLLRGHKFQCYHLNDISDTPRLFMDAVSGKYRDERRWIDRRTFFAEKDADPYVRMVWSFGNEGRCYIYGTEVEPWKKALHHARVLGDVSLLREFGIESDGSIEDVKQHHDEYKEKYRRWYIREKVKSSEDYDRLKNLQRLDSLQRLERLQSLERLEITTGDYQDVKIEEDSVIYCDIPYRGTKGYGKVAFDHERFYDWACSQSAPVYISEYQMPEDRFECVREIEHVSILSAIASNKVTERIFIPREQEARPPRQLSLF